MNWRDEYARGVLHDGLPLPPLSPVMIAYSDVGKRAANCRFCKSVIPKGENRGVIALKKSRASQARVGGGVFTAERFYVHASCFAYMVGVPRQSSMTLVHCYSCRCVIDDGTAMTRSNRHMYMTGASTGYAEICEECVNLPQFGMCSVCRSWSPKYNLSPIVEAKSYYGEKFSQGDLCCDHCEMNLPIVRVKEKKRAERDDRKMERKLEKIREYYDEFTAQAG